MLDRMKSQLPSDQDYLNFEEVSASWPEHVSREFLNDAYPDQPHNGHQKIAQHLFDIRYWKTKKKIRSKNEFLWGQIVNFLFIFNFFFLGGNKKKTKFLFQSPFYFIFISSKYKWGLSLL